MATKLLTKKQLKAALDKLEFFVATPKATKLNATFDFDDHVAALVFIARITVHAEVQQHHPDVTFTYCTVKVALTTHDAKGLTKKDIDLAKVIEKIYNRKRG